MAEVVAAVRPVVFTPAAVGPFDHLRDEPAELPAARPPARRSGWWAVGWSAGLVGVLAGCALCGGWCKGGWPARPPHRPTRRRPSRRRRTESSPNAVAGLPPAEFAAAVRERFAGRNPGLKAADVKLTWETSG